jgi:SP family sugar:H+ symporter-like MFS transporter
MKRVFSSHPTLVFPSSTPDSVSNTYTPNFTRVLHKMRFFPKKTEEATEKGTPANSTPTDTPARGNSHTVVDEHPEGRVPFIAVVLGACASIGGFMFGYESGQISGFLAMPDFVERFGDNGEFSPVRQGTIVGLLA